MSGQKRWFVVCPLSTCKNVFEDKRRIKYEKDSIIFINVIVV